jgi:hypothetical protein
MKDKKEIIRGFDIVRQPADLDWEMIKKGYKFVYVKVTEGSAYSAKNITNALEHARSAAAAGLKIGYYHVAQPDENYSADSYDESLYFITTLRTMGFPEPTLPYAVELTDPYVQFDKVVLDSWIYSFLINLESLTARDHATFPLRSTTSWLDSHLPIEHNFSQQPYWSLEKTPTALPRKFDTPVLRQESQDYTVPNLNAVQVPVSVYTASEDFWLAHN